MQRSTSLPLEEERYRPTATVALPFAGARRTRQLLGVALLAVLLANTAILVNLWLQGGGITSVNSMGALFTSIGRITGLLGAYLLLVQVILVARISLLERVTGFDRYTRWHRLNGKACLYLVLAHVVFITLGYALTDRLSVTAEASTLLSSYPGMIAATVGTALIVLVAVSSFVIVQRRLRYEAWYVVHLMAYAGIWLSWYHEIPTGNELVTNATAAAYWTALYLVTLGLVVLFRFVRPALRGIFHGLRVEEVTREAPRVYSIRMTGRRLDLLHARAGQFFLWRFLSRDRWWEAHPFSLSAAPDGRSLRITVKAAGDFTQHLGRIRPGTRVLAEGPFGDFTEEVRRREGVALVAGGIGITPIRALLQEMQGDIVLIYRVMYESDLVFREEIDHLARERGIRVYYVVGDHRVAGNERLLSPEHLLELVPDLPAREVYVCGPPVMAQILERSVRRVGVPRKYIHTDQFAL
jgi:predicted ferric reductase